MRGLWVWIIGALLIGGLIGWSLGTQKTLPSVPTPSSAITFTKQEIDLKNTSRKLWEDHITWTRSYIIAAASDSPSASSDATRLLKNQEDIGNTIKPYYGEDAGNKLTALLKEHILIATDLIKAAKAGDNATIEATDKKWHDNADQIAELLTSVNPKWSKQQWRNMLNEHLALTTQEAADILRGNFELSIGKYDRLHLQALEMADVMADGIIAQFPNKFGK